MKCFKSSRFKAALPLVCLVLLAGFFSITARAQTTNTYQEGVNGYSGTREVTISTQDPVDTGGNGFTEFDDPDSDGELLILLPFVVGDPNLDHDYEARSLLRFDNLNLPPGASVQAATLQMTFENYDTAALIQGEYLQAAWNPSSAGTSQGIGWIYRDTNADWAVPGASGAGADVVSGQSFTLSGFAASGADTITVTLNPAVVQNWAISPALDQGVLLINANSNVTLRMFTSWYTNNPAYRPKLTISYVPGVPPGISQAAAAAPNPVTGVTNGLTVLGSNSHGEPSLTYTWSALSKPSGAADPTFSPNGNNSAKSSTATYGMAGNYTLQAVIQNTVGLTVTSTVPVTVQSVYSQITVSPPSKKVVTNATQQFLAVAADQFGQALAVQPGFTWSVTGGESVNSSGLFQAGTVPGGPFQVRAQSGAIIGSASVTVGLPNVPPFVSLTNPVAGQNFFFPSNVTLTASASDSDGSVTNVQFFADGDLLGQTASTPYSFVWTNPPVGPHTLTVTAFDNDGGSSTSAAVSISVVMPTAPSQFTDGLTASGAASPVDLILDVVADAQPAPDSLTSAFSVGAPNAQASRLLNLINPAIAIPYDSQIREIEAYWNGTALPLIDPSGTELVEDAHAYGSLIPFFKPLFSVAAIPAGTGTLEIRAFDANHTQLTNAFITNLSVVKPPAPVAASALAALAHPRIYLTAARLAAIQARPPSDIARQRYENTLDYFTNALALFPDVLSTDFSDAVYEPEAYIPLLALTYQLRKNDNPTLATLAAAAAHTLTTNMAAGYATGLRDFDADDGYNIRFDLREMMLAYDWIYDQFSPAERATLVGVATNWVNWYHTPGYPDNMPGGDSGPGYAETLPTDNYYSGELQGMALSAVATAGDNPNDDDLLASLRAKLGNEIPILNQRAAGGDWPEGWNYGPYTVLELSLVNTLLRDVGEDWSAEFDWLQSLPRSLLYMTAPDYSQTRSYGAYTGDYEHKTSPSMLAVLSGTATDGAFASLIYSNITANPNADFAGENFPSSESFCEMIFATNAPPPDLSALPLSYFNRGTGRFFSRSSLTDPQAFFVSTENTSYSGDHYGYADGDVRLYQGTNCLVCPAAYAAPGNGGDDGELGTAAFSTYLVNSNAQDSTLGRNNQNTFLTDNGTYSAIVMRFESSWAANRYDEGIVDPGNPLDYLIREVVHLRPGTLIVRDLHRRRHDTDTLAAQFHLGLTNTVQTTGGITQIGALRISTFYPPGVNVLFTNDNDNNGDLIGTRMQLDFTNTTAPMELVTVFSETLTASSYTNRVLTLSDGARLTFASDGTLSVLSAPTLAIKLAGNSLTLSWPSSFTGWKLQQNPDLASTHWTDSGGMFHDDGSIKSVTLTAPAGNTFFHLTQ